MSVPWIRAVQKHYEQNKKEDIELNAPKKIKEKLYFIYFE